MNGDIRPADGEFEAPEKADLFMTFQPLAKWVKFIGGSGGVEKRTRIWRMK